MAEHQTVQQVGDSPAAALADLRVQPAGLAAVARLLPWAIVVIAAAALIYGADQMFMSGLAAAAIAAFLVSRLVPTVRDALTSVWKRKLLATRTSTVLADQDFAAYLRDFQKSLNSRKSLVFGAVFAIASVPQFFISRSSTNPIEVLRSSGVAGMSSLLGEWRVVGLLLVAAVAFLLGLLAWRMTSVGYQIFRLGSRFDCRVQPQHPDQAGGFGALGEVCFLNALILIVPSTFLGVWRTLIANIPAHKAFYGYLADWFGVLLVITFGLAVVAFVAPLYGVHRGMMRERSRLQEKLDDIGNAMYELRGKIREAAEQGTSTAVTDLEKEHAVLLEVYRKEQDVPTWPVDTGLVRKYFVTQIVPLLSITKVADAIAARLSGGS